MPCGDDMEELMSKVNKELVPKVDKELVLKVGEQKSLPTFDAFD